VSSRKIQSQGWIHCAEQYSVKRSALKSSKPTSFWLAIRSARAGEISQRAKGIVRRKEKQRRLVFQLVELGKVKLLEYGAFNFVFQTSVCKKVLRFEKSPSSFLACGR